MKKTGFLFDERYLLHETGSYHPEVPARLQAVYQGIKEAGLLARLTLIHASLSDLKWIEAVHDKEYIKRFEMACVTGKSTFDCPDNQICPATYETALLAVGGILDATRLVMNAEIDNVFCAVRPPGHHAEINKAMGFCYFNNVAIAARYLQKEWGIKRDLFPVFESFKPEVIIVSSGFDAHVDDDMSDIKLSTEAFSWIIKSVVEMSDKYSNGRLISVLEGGYSLKRLPELAKNHVEILLDYK